MAMRNDDWWSKRSLVGCAVFASVAAGVSGCAHGADSEEESAEAVKVEKLESRIQELEKTNGRLSVRLDEMEDEVFLLQDRVEAHRLALKRRGFMNGGNGGQARAKAPEPTPQTNYGQQRNQGRYPVRGRSGHSPEDRRKPAPDDGATRIPLSNQQAQGRQGRRARGEAGENERGASAGSERAGASKDRARRGRTRERQRPSGGGESEEKVVITEEDFQKFANDVEEGDGGGAADSGGSGGSASGKEAKRPVTDEKLPTGDGDEPSAKANERAPSTGEPEAPAPELDEDPFSGKSGLDLYKAALGKYRSGEYATALEGFEQFVSNGPRKDYRDNGLYWVGECHYGLGDFEKAVEYFQKVIDEEPGGNKVPDAMLKMALAYREMGMKDRAQRTLEKLTDRYPSTNAGRLGEKKLSELNS